MNKQLVLVFGHSPASNIGLVRSLSEIGCDSIIISSALTKKKLHPDFYSRYVVGHYFLDPKQVEQTLDFLITKFGKKTPKPILIPTSDVAANFFDICYDTLNQFFLLPKLDHSLNDSYKLSDKSYQKEIAKQSGLNVLNSWKIDISRDDISIPEDVIYPCYVKGCRSIEISKSYQKRCDDKDQLKKHLDLISQSRSASVLVEPFASINKEWGIMALCNGSDIFIPAITEFITMGKGRMPGVSIQGVVHSFDSSNDLYNSVCLFLKKINMVGLCNIDLIEMNGVLYFSELNLRYAAYCYAINKNGVNLPSSFISIMRNNSFQSGKMVKRQLSYFNEYVAFQDILSNKLSLKEYFKIKKGSDEGFLNDKIDRKPFVYAILFFICQLLHKPFIRKP